jgi:hypothetical protein
MSQVKYLLNRNLLLISISSTIPIRKTCIHSIGRHHISIVQQMCQNLIWSHIYNSWYHRKIIYLQLHQRNRHLRYSKLLPRGGIIKLRDQRIYALIHQEDFRIISKYCKVSLIPSIMILVLVKISTIIHSHSNNKIDIHLKIMSQRFWLLRH